MGLLKWLGLEPKFVFSFTEPSAVRHHFAARGEERPYLHRVLLPGLAGIVLALMGFSLAIVAVNHLSNRLLAILGFAIILVAIVVMWRAALWESRLHPLQVHFLQERVLVDNPQSRYFEWEHEYRMIHRAGLTHVSIRGCQYSILVMTPSEGQSLVVGIPPSVNAARIQEILTEKGIPFEELGAESAGLT